MKQRLILAALAVLALPVPAVAQDIPPGLAPYEILTSVRSTGLEPLSRPIRRGPRYVLRAVDGEDRQMRVVVDAYSGRVLSITPVATASRMPPPPPPLPPGATMGPYERMAPGYVPGGPPVADEDDAMYDEPGAPRPPGVVPDVPPRSRAAGLPRPGEAPPPVIRAMPPGGGTGSAAGPAPWEPHVITSTEPDQNQNGLLPPPPERFPHRVTPAPVKPKPPVKRASAGPPKAAPPKHAPLPKAKPAEPAHAGDAAATPATPPAKPAQAVPAQVKPDETQQVPD